MEKRKHFKNIYNDVWRYITYIFHKSFLKVCRCLLVYKIICVFSSGERWGRLLKTTKYIAQYEVTSFLHQPRHMLSCHTTIITLPHAQEDILRGKWGWQVKLIYRKITFDMCHKNCKYPILREKLRIRTNSCTQNIYKYLNKYIHMHILMNIVGV